MPSTSAQVKEYRRSLPGLLTLIYSNQKMTSNKMGRPLPTYTKQELADWLQQQPNFQLIWDNWVNSGYEKYLSPSIDRIDNNLGYTLSNIQLVTWRENLLNQKKQNISGEYLHAKSKAVTMLTLEGDEIETFPSLAIAARSINGRSVGISNIAAVANGKWKTAYGYKWKWALS